jgi:thioredoxin-related protein
VCAPAHAGRTHFVASICPFDGFAGAKPREKGKRRLQVTVMGYKNIKPPNMKIGKLLFSLFMSAIILTSCNFSNRKDIISDLKTEVDTKFINYEFESMDNVLKKAKEQNKKIFIYLTSDGCGPCIKMERQVFCDSTLSKFYNENFVCVKSRLKYTSNEMKSSDFKKLNKTQMKFMDEFEIQGTPAFVVLSPNGDLVHIRRGYMGMDEFIQFGKDALSSEKNYITLKSKIEKGDYSFETVRLYLNCIPRSAVYMDDYFEFEAQKVLDKYFKTQEKKDLLSENNWELIEKHVSNPKSEPFKYLLDNQNIFYQKYGKETIDKKIFNVLFVYISGDISSKRYKQAKEEIKGLNYPQAKALVKYKSLTLNAQDDLNIFTKQIDGIFTDFYYFFEYEINQYAWQIYETSIIKESKIEPQTITTAVKWMKTITSYRQKSEYQETYAHLLSKLGEKEKAAEEQKKAIEIAKKEKYGIEQISYLEKELEEMMKL